jgi:hypothetical protein
MSRALELAGETLRVETVFEDRFDGGLEHWVAEGTPRVSAGGGRLSVDAVGGVPHVATVWCRTPFAGDQVIEYTCRVEPTVDDLGRGETNMNVLLFASRPDGRGLAETAAERTGAYAEYHQLHTYILTYLNSDRQGRSPIHGDCGEQLTRIRLRRCPGFRLMEELWRPPIEKGRQYRFTVAARGRRTQLFVDGLPVLDCREAEAPHRAGLHGYRTWMSHISSDLFRVSRILP